MRRLVRYLSRKGIINNRFVNQLWIFMKLDKKLADYVHLYKDFTLDRTKSLQELSGYSLHPDVTSVLDRIKLKMSEYVHDLPVDANVLDIGCGPGLFLKEYSSTHNKFGVDITPEMLDLAREVNPGGTFYQGDFLKTPIAGSFDMINCTGLLIYINRSRITDFFAKVHGLLKPGGIFFLSYPHAIESKDLWFHDINYVNYSPDFLERTVKGEFEIIYHKHVMDDRYVGSFDKTVYKHPIDPTWKYYKNSSILVLRKK